MTKLRRTKIVTTLGPAVDRPGELERLILAGANVVRLNFSHGKHEDHKNRIDATRAIAKKHGLAIGILADLQGPKIRVANFIEGSVMLAEGAKFALDADMDPDAGTKDAVGIDYKALPQDVSRGDMLLLNDGAISTQVEKVEGSIIHTIVVSGGVLSNHKGINRQGGGLSAKALTDKDRKDLAFAVSQDVDYIAISFPRDKADVEETKKLIAQHGGNAGVISKIERIEAVGHIDEIIEAGAGVMVARGDLAVEIGDAEVPVVQKQIIRRARALNKPVITATQMMESMIHSTVPTRAEVSDVANAVFDYTDAVMLSAESASGDHPTLVVETMARACIGAEKLPQVSKHRVELEFKELDEATAMAAMYTANHMNIRAIVCLTESGSTPLWMSRIRSEIPIYALSRNKKSLGSMALYRGVFPVEFDVTQFSRDDINDAAISKLMELHQLEAGDRVILTKGDHMGIAGGTNTMKIVTVKK